MDCNNPYEHLKTPCLDDSGRIFPTLHTLTVSSHPDETIMILTSRAPGGWVYGYTVYWANGHTSHRHPTRSGGLFRTEQDARLYCIGFFKAYLQHFQSGTVTNIRAAESRLITPILPL